jgi:oligosaccharyltransferase complex subunit beta
MVALRRALGQLLLLTGFALARSSTGNKVLVILDPKVEQKDYSVFFRGLTSAGYQARIFR